MLSSIGSRAPCRLVILDLDDTLYPERDFVLSGFRAAAEVAAERLGLPPRRLLREFLAQFRADTRCVFDRALTALAPGSADLAAELVQEYREHTPQLHLPAESAEVLAELGARWPLALISDGDPAQQRRKLAGLGIADRFGLLLLTGERGPGWGKPSELPFKAAAEHFGIPPAAAVYVADNPLKDFRGPNLIGMASVRVRRPRGVYSHLEPASGWAPTVTVASLREAARWIVDDSTPEPG